MVTALQNFPDIEIRAVSAAATRPLRSALLRPAQAPEELVYSGDEAPDTLHAGVFLEEKLAGIASVCREPLPGHLADDHAWRLRGMAVTPELRGRGYGHALLHRCINHVFDHRGTLLWCNARTPVIGFYHASGFETSGSEFEISGIGPHVLMILPIKHQEPAKTSG